MSTISPATAPAADPSAAPETSQVGTLIRGHRLRIGLTQRELADLSTISVRAIRDLEQGKARRPRTDTVRLIADALRLGPRARTALEAAAQQGRCGGSAGAALDAESPAPPTALHGLTGREAETEVMVRELSSGAERLVNVVGLSGVGKTRLALEVANRLHAAGLLSVLWHAFPGAARDYLAADTGPGQQIVRAGVVHLFESGPSDGASELAELLGDRAVLLVLDGAPERAPRFDRLTRLMRDCPGLRLLVTSEQPWQVPGERPFLLAPLEVPAAAEPVSGDRPDAAGVAGSASVRLFLDHVRRVRPEFAPSAADLAEVARICRRLDGHPMALGAAASWLAVCDLPTLSRSLDRDPGPLLDHLAGGDGGRRFQDALHRGLARLTSGHRALLAALCAAPEGEFGLDEVVGLTGLGLPECGRMVRDLLIGGVIRPSHEAGRSRFRVLQLVRAFRAEHRPEDSAHSGHAGPAGPRGVAPTALAAAAR
ncbi:helix-turn-helix domain-containing protein [Streptomyces sp. NBC_00239]|uniref:helix-turn-helix domain-containing protein n=1 Tax=Streptomyces sp. NBC_00239 TaxID=2903640 RepID=UPI002E2C15F5|nr:helix-turn-helix domain-containing protein [Streptomyces sp. NBC_00239]